MKQIANILGEKTFQEGLRRFLKRKQFSNADHDDLWQALTEQAQADAVLDKDTNMNDIMNGWIHQPGFPLLTVTPDYQNNVLKFSQVS